MYSYKDSKLQSSTCMKPLEYLLDAKVMGLSSYYMKPGEGDPTIDILLISIGDIVDATINIETVKKVTIKKTGKLGSDTILPGDVVLTLRDQPSHAQPFRAAVAGKEIAGAALSANLVGLRCSNQIRPEILAAWLNSSAGQRALAPKAGVSTLISLPLKDLLQIEIAVPSLEQQEILSKYLALAAEYTRLLKEEQKLLGSVIDSMMNTL